MPFIRRYKDLGTDLDGLYNDVKKELQQDKDLSIAVENERPSPPYERTYHEP